MIGGRGTKALALAVLLIASGAIAGCAEPEDTTGGEAPGSADAPDDDGEATKDGTDDGTTDASDGEEEPPDGSDAGTEEAGTGSSSMAFVQDNAYRDDLGYFHVVGIVENKGDANASFVSIDGEFKDSNGNVVETSSTFAVREVVPAGETAPFELQVSDENAKIDSYDLSVDSTTTDDSPTGDEHLETKGVTTTTDSVGYHHVKGEVENTGDIAASSVEVIGALFDDAGQIQGVQFTFTNPEDIQAGQTASFDLQEKADQRSFADHQLWVQASAMGADESAGAQLKVPTNTSYRDDIGYFHVVGLAENVGEMNASFVEVSGTFYDADGNVVETSTTFTQRDVVPAGERSPFHLQVQDDRAEIERYKLDISAESTDDTPPGHGDLSTQGVTTETDSIGYYHVKGEVHNEGSKEAKSVEVIGAFYNAEGDIVGTAFTYTDPEDIEPGGTASFDLQTDPGDRSFDDYELWIEPRAMG